MKTNINGRVLPATITSGVGYADVADVIDALGGPAKVLAMALAALGVPVDVTAPKPLIGLRKLAEVLHLPHEYMPAPDDTFYMGALKSVPAEPVGAGVDPWLPVVPVIANGPGQRSPGALQRVIAQFHVAVNPRYAIRDTTGDGEDDTFCNIFAWDYGEAMGAPIPYYLDDQNRPSRRGAPGAYEVNANAMVYWMQKYGWLYGWSSCGAQKALDAANAGKPAVACWLNTAGGPGHIAVVRPGVADPVRGVPIAQAGSRNFDDGFLVDGFGASRVAAVRFYIHD